MKKSKIRNPKSEQNSERQNPKESSADIATFTLDTGLTLALENIPSVSSASFALLLPMGSALDPEGKCGLTAVLVEILLRGAGDRDARRLTEAFDSIGLERSVDYSSELIALSGSLLSRDLSKALELFRDVLVFPRLDQVELAPSIDLCMQSVAAVEDTPSEKLFVELNKRYMPWPHSRPSKGVIEEMETITIADLRGIVSKFSPRGAVLSIAGDIDFVEVREQVGQIFACFRSDALYPRPDVRPAIGGGSHVEQESKAQVQIGMALGSLPMNSPDYAKAILLVTILSGGMSSRLFVEVREKKGLVYSVRASYSTMKDRGDIYVYAGTTPERAHETVAVIHSELARLSEGVSAEELSRAKTQLRSSIVMSQESSRSRAMTMASDIFRLGRVRDPQEIIGSIEQITLDALNDFLRITRFEPMTVTLGPKWEGAPSVSVASAA